MGRNKRICIVGPGAIGGVVAGLLTRAGQDITLVTKYEDLAEKISSSGIEISSHLGKLRIPIPSVARIDQLKGVFDYALLVTKAGDMEEAARALLPFLDENSRVVSMQNGICEPLLAEIVGKERTIGCVVGWGGTFLEPGKVEMSSGGECVLGNWQRESDQELQVLAGLMEQVIKTRMSEDILSELYSKMVVNSCITSMGVISGLYLGEILKKKQARNLFIEIIREAIQVAGAMGLKVAPGAGGRIDFYNFLAPGLFSGFKRHMTIRVIGLKYRRLKSSSLQSIERGRKTEVDYYNGYISARGREFKIPTPVNDQLTRMVNEIEEGARQVGPANFEDLP